MKSRLRPGAYPNNSRGRDAVICGSGQGAPTKSTQWKGSMRRRNAALSRKARRPFGLRRDGSSCFVVPRCHISSLICLLVAPRITSRHARNAARVRYSDRLLAVLPANRRVFNSWT